MLTLSLGGPSLAVRRQSYVVPLSVVFHLSGGSWSRCVQYLAHAVESPARRLPGAVKALYEESGCLRIKWDPKRRTAEPCPFDPLQDSVT